MSEFLAFADALERRIAAFCASTGLRADGDALVSCGCRERHYVRAEALEPHLRAVHGVKFPPRASHQFFYAKAPGVQRVDAHVATADAEQESDSAAEDVEVDESQPQSLLEPQAADEASSSRDAGGTANDREAAREHVVQAIAETASDAGEFYAKVQRWRRIPRAFEVLAWDESSGGASRKAVQGWLIAELSRTVFKDAALEMDLVEYVLELLEHPEFCQPDLLVLELHEFLGTDVSRFVLALWKFLVVEVAMRAVFKTTKESLAKHLRSREEQAAAERARVKLQQLRELEQAQLKRKRGGAAAQDDSSQRDYKRRRPTYRGKGGGAKSAQLVLREVLAKQMLTLSMETGRELVEVEDDDARDGARAASELPAGAAAAEWTRLTDALHRVAQPQIPLETAPAERESQSRPEPQRAPQPEPLAPPQPPPRKSQQQQLHAHVDGMGCAESRNTVQPQGGGGAFSVVALGGGAPATSTPSRFFRRAVKPSGDLTKPPKKHKPNSLLPEPQTPTGSPAGFPESSSSPSAAAITGARAAAAPSPVAKGPTMNLLPSAKQNLQHLALEALSIEFLKAVKSGDVAYMERVAQQAARAQHPPLVDIRGMWESTPLIYACQYGHPAAALWLLERGACAHVQNEKGVTALLLASLEGMADVVDWILAPPQAAAGDDGAAVRAHVDKQVGVVYNSAADLNARVNPLLAASMNGHVDIVRKLLAQGASANLPVAAAATGAAAGKQFALLLAAKYGHAGVVRLLIQHGADFATSDANGNHALLLACEASKEECATELLRLLPSTRLAPPESGDAAVAQASAYEASWKQANCHGLTALHFAAANGLLAVVQRMLVGLGWGRDREFVDATNVNRRECALLMACRKRQSEVVQLLVACGADFELPDRGGTTALQVLAREKKDELVKLCERRRAADEVERDGGGSVKEQPAALAPGGAVLPQAQPSGDDRVASTVGSALRSVSFSHTRSSSDRFQPQQATAPPELAASASGVLEPEEKTLQEWTGDLPVDTAQARSSDEAPRATVIAENVSPDVETTTGDSVEDTSSPLSSLSTDATGEAAVETVETAAPNVGEDEAPQSASRKPSKPKHRKREQPSPPRRPRQKKSVAKDDDAPSAAADAVADEVVDATPLVPVRSSAAAVDAGAEDDAASETRAPTREFEDSAALGTPTSTPPDSTDALATQDSRSPPPAEDDMSTAANDEDAPSVKNQRRRKKKQHAGKRSKHGASSSPTPATGEGELLGDEDATGARSEEAKELES